jgi:nucleosome binding factor SPN SPT16 subunit
MLLMHEALLAQKKVGVLTKDTSSGPFVDEWKRAYGNISKEVEEVDIALAISAAALSVKDENELVRSAHRCHSVNNLS